MADKVKKPKEQQPIISFQYFQPPKPKQEKQFNMASLMPIINPGIAYPPQFNYMYPFSQIPPMMPPPIIKNYQINTTGPTADHQRLMMIHEDVLPKKGDYIVSSTTLGERLEVYNFIRSSIFNNVDGENMGLEGTDKKSLLSYIKFGELNPYNTYKYSYNPYKGLPFGYLIYRSCYPIQHHESGGAVICARDSTAINVRIYRLIEGSYAIIKTQGRINFFKFDEWREIRFYEIIREEILKKKVCPHFPFLFGYFICENSNIDFNYNYQIRNKEAHPKEQKYLTDHEYTPEQIEEMAMNRLKNDISNGTITAITAELIEIKKQDLINDLNTINKKELRGELTPEQFNEMARRMKLTQNIAEGTIRILTPTLLEIKKKVLKNEKVLSINPNVYLGKAVVLLTESPTYTLYGWASKTYKRTWNVKEMINRGTHSDTEWKNIIFQILITLYVMSVKKLYIRNFSVEKNIYVKDLPTKGPIIKYWKYIINDIEYYLPNLGFLVQLDTNFRDITNTKEEANLSFIDQIEKKNPEYKVGGKNFPQEEKDDVSILNKVDHMFEAVFKPDVFNDIEFTQSGGVRPSAEIMDLLNRIRTTGIEVFKNKMFDNILSNMTGYLHNRIGTYLKENEVQNVRKEEIKNWRRGQLFVIEDGGAGIYKIVSFIKTNQDNITCTIFTRNSPNQDIIIKTTQPKADLISYSRAEPIAQNFKPEESSLIEEDLLETYVIKSDDVK